MRIVQAQRFVEVPEGVTVEVKARNVVVTGPRGSLTRSFKHISVEMTKLSESKLELTMWFGNRKQLACLRTVQSHIQNMITGVTKGFCYKMRLAYAHFPINIEFEEGLLIVKNFIGQRLSRALKIPAGVTVEKSANVKDQLEITGNDIDAVSQMAALIHGSTRVVTKDIRKFLDGVYVSEKGAIGELVAV